MSRFAGFNSPFMLGFDHFERLLDRAAKSSAEGYPPYNIEQTGENRIRITLAVAGFAEKDLSVTVEDNQLVIRGRQDADEGERVFLHRGIAAR
ncbi:MAG: Hsp20 family protein, partial [Alphaproteobacteria bacterium]|nr:Hsp20 family protein [Alphaproteobacteria bacterium]